MKINHGLLFKIAFTGLFLIFSNIAFAGLMNTGNVLMNAGAESGMQGWTTGGNFRFSTRSSATNIGGYLDQTEGQNWFWTSGGPANTSGYISQSIDVSQYDFSNGYSTVIWGGDAFASSARRPVAYSTNVAFVLSFFNDLGQQIGGFTNWVLNQQGSPERALDWRREAVIPKSTSSMTYKVIGRDGTYSSVIIGLDDLYLGLNHVAVPEPDSVLVLMIGIYGIFRVRKIRVKN